MKMIDIAGPDSNWLPACRSLDSNLGPPNFKILREFPASRPLTQSRSPVKGRQCRGRDLNHVPSVSPSGPVALNLPLIVTLPSMVTTMETLILIGKVTINGKLYATGPW